jgi:hypothetical protein
MKPEQYVIPITVFSIIFVLVGITATIFLLSHTNTSTTCEKDDSFNMAILHVQEHCIEDIESTNPRNREFCDVYMARDGITSLYNWGE